MIRTGFVTRDAAIDTARKALLSHEHGAFRIWERELKSRALRYCITEQNKRPTWAGEWTALDDLVFVDGAVRRRNPSDE